MKLTNADQKVEGGGGEIQVLMRELKEQGKIYVKGKGAGAR